MTIKDAGRPWKQLPQVPLSGRRSALAVADDDHVYIFGGLDASGAPLKDSARFDLDSLRWEPLALAPRGIDASSAVADNDEYIYMLLDSGLASAGEAALLEFHKSTGQWRELSLASLPRLDYSSLTTWGDDLIIVSSGVLGGTDYVYSSGVDEFTPLIPPPPPGLGRRITEVAGELIFTSSMEDQDRGTSSFVIASLSPTGWGEQVVEHASPVNHWLASGNELVSPGCEMQSDGVATGGRFDSATHQWTALPAASECAVGGGGAFGPDDATFWTASGPVLDISRGRWVSLPPPFVDMDWAVEGQSVAGDSEFLVTFGGTRADGTLSADAFILSLADL